MTAPPAGVASGTPAQISPVPMQNTGTIDVASGQQLLLSNGPATLTGGTLEGSGGSVDLQAPVSAAGTITLGSGFTLELDSTGSLDGTFSLAGSGSVDWTGGPISGTISVASTIPVNISASSLHQVTGRPNGQTSVLTTHGRVSIAAGTTASPDTIWVNFGDQWVTAGTMTAPQNTVLAAASCCGPTFGLKNTGTFTVSAGTGTVAADGLEFDNAGKLKLSSGTLVLAEFEQTAGSTTLAGGSISDVQSPLSLTGGVLTGSGTISASVQNGATVQPATSGGALTITGSYQQTAAGVLDTVLAGPTAGAGFGQLDVGGAATLAGKLNAVISSGFVPTSGQTFAALVYGSRTAQFSSLTGTPGFGVVYKPTEAQLIYGAPWITALSPDAGPTSGGTHVTITGGDFTSTSTVKFGSTAATSVTFVSAGELQALAPAHASGTITVTVKNAIGSSLASSAALYAYGPPAVASFTPVSTITGDAVTITGTSFVPGAAVAFAGLPSPQVTFVSATALKAIVPNGAVAGVVTVSTAAGTASTSKVFTPTFSVTSFSPSSGPPGTVVQLDGVGFNSKSSVKFNGVAATTVTYVSATELKATVPAMATSGPMTVTNATTPAGTVTSATSFAVS